MGVCFALLLVVSAVPGMWAATVYETIFRESFEEATLGGTYSSPTPPGGTDTTGVSPTGGEIRAFVNDNGEVVSPGLGGSSQALRASDNNTGYSLRLDARPSRHPTGDHLLASMDFRATGPLGGGPLQLLLQTPSQGNLIGFLVWSDLHFWATDSASALFSDAYSSSALSTGKEYRMLVDADLDNYTYDFSVTNLTDSAVAFSVTGLDFIHDPALHTDGFGIAQCSFGFADFGGAPAAFTVDNINLAVPATAPKGTVIVVK